ncbi:MAG: DUF4097 family beta strand repeat protein [Pyrinomonadaceae bacterium]|nr:DUF4097 family beta strand repeat protein [Pyrinomonadaceae bacterium]
MSERMTKFKKFLKTTAVGTMLCVASAVAMGQGVAPPPLPKPPVAPKPAGPMFSHFPRGENHERSIAVAPNANLSLCVVQGLLRVNGWKRNEIRIFVKSGSPVAFKVLERTPEQQPVWLMATGNDPKRTFKAFSECLWGEEIEIDVPEGASIGLKGQETRTVVDRVKKVSVKNVAGDIVVRNVSSGVSASTFQGDITVEESRGALMLESTTGNIVVFEAGPSEIGDTFKAKTNSGTISMQAVKYRQVEVGSISGTVGFSGPILSGANYSFGTSNGSIRLVIPSAAAFKLAATFASGSFSSELPFKILTENLHETGKSIVGEFGTGNGAVVKVTTNNGTIGIRRDQ